MPEGDATEADAPIELGDLTDLGDGEMRCFEHIGRDGILVCRVGADLYALTDNCSHADTPLSEGRLRGFGVTCALHGASFDVRTGEHSGPPAWEGVPCHVVSEVDGIAAVVLTDPTRRDGPTADGSHMQTR